MTKEAIKNRYDFMVIFDVKDGNPNGDPNNTNQPRVDIESGHGIITDVCIKRKIRNYVQIKQLDPNTHDIYVKEGTVLGNSHKKAYQDLGLVFSENVRGTLTEDMKEELISSDIENLINGIVIDGDEIELDSSSFADDENIKNVESLVKTYKNKELKNLFRDMIKKVKAEVKKQPSKDQIELGRKYMCNKFFDVRTFGGVLSIKSAPNCGQIRGAVQLTFARSVDPIHIEEHTITRCASTKDMGESSFNQTMGSKYTVPYALYVQYGYVCPAFAKKTMFTDDDINLLFDAVENMFEHDHSASRGRMVVRKIIIFKHNSPLGNVPSHKLFDRIKITKKNDMSAVPPRDYDDYVVNINTENMPETIICQII